MPLIHNDNTNNRQERSYETQIEEPPEEERKMFPVEHSQKNQTPAAKNKRPNIIKAGVNALKGVGRSARIFKSARKETVAKREELCHKCELNVHDIDKNGRYINEWCGHKYLDVTIGKVSRKDVRGCGCRLRWKRITPNERCPKEPPDWVEEHPIE